MIVATTAFGDVAPSVGSAPDLVLDVAVEADVLLMAPMACCAHCPATRAFAPTRCRAIWPAPNPVPDAISPQRNNARRRGIKTVRVSMACLFPFLARVPEVCSRA